MLTVLVTGAAGFIGSHTCDRLLQEGHQVIGVDNFRTGHRENLTAALAQPRFRLVEADVAADGVLDGLVASARPDAIIHLAALVSVPESITDPTTNFRLNVEATHRVAEAARTHGVKRIVFASSAAVFGDNPELPLTERSATRPISPYGGAKLGSEALLLGHAAAYGITVRCQRYFNVFGPRQDPRSPYSGVISIFCERFAAGRTPTIYGDGEQTRDFISVHDVARANVLAATAPGITTGIANICTGTPTSLNQLAAILRREFANAPAPSHGEPRAGDIRHSLGAPERARAELGFAAAHPLEPALRELVASVR
ncbi:NAD-dependent epimerase/dehydratase family protein [Opitutus sp. ER46]|uniref:NAD-dependent epimerase/dehydratase family protein n=1 Tax=Opitutus sp. ER46 TaxID=2161864 RepID=UPI000D31BFD6|nr:NAD-dependent epimerase/dehydratase family protein [Opitutus sp. ER46]PTX92357.1 NAD-dependent dehydratase [Opitutus sp. ER46]